MLRLVMAFFLFISFAAAQTASTQKPGGPKSKDLKMTPTETSATEAPSASARLPVRRVVLYKNGVGYFEHTGRVRGSQEVNIDFTT